MKTRLFTFLTWLWLLALAVLVTIYVAWLIYPLEVDWLHLTNQVIITKQDLLKNFNSLMFYLTNPFSSNLSMPDFPSSKDGLQHFRDVKHLFHLTQAVFVILLVPAWRFLKNSRAEKSLFLHQRAFAIAALAPIFIGFATLFIGFDNFFTSFHQVLFPGATNWLFNPVTDPIIWVLPEEFFLHCFLIFFIIYELIMWSLVFSGKKQFSQYLKNNPNKSESRK